MFNTKVDLIELMSLKHVFERRDYFSSIDKIDCGWIKETLLTTFV